jgi:hypothetical protein
MEDFRRFGRLLPIILQRFSTTLIGLAKKPQFGRGHKISITTSLYRQGWEVMTGGSYLDLLGDQSATY